MSGCRSFFAAVVLMAASSVVGGVIGAPMGAFGAIGGAFILPWALVMGTLGWGAISFPWLVLRFFASSLPELATVRALAGFLLVSPPAAAWAGWYMATVGDATGLVLWAEPIAFGVAAIPLAGLVAVFGRDGMGLFLSVAAGAAEGAAD